MKQEGHKKQFSKYNKKENVNFYPYLTATGKKRRRSESNNSDQSDEDCLPQKQEVSKKYKSFESSSYDVSIGYGKKPASVNLY